MEDTRNIISRIKRRIRPWKYQLKKAEARIGRLEKQVDSLQQQLRDIILTQTDFLDDLRDLLNPLVPHKAHGFNKIRVGVARDGAYVMLDDFKNITHALSVGIGKEVSWDLDLARRNIEVWQYDPTVTNPVKHPRFTFFAKRVVSSEKEFNAEVSLSRIIDSTGARDPCIILKIDIEGAEWEVLETVREEQLQRCRQIVIEVHDLHRYREIGWLRSANVLFRKLCQTHKLIHVHGNNFNTTFCGGIRECPRDLEMTFALKAYYHLEISNETFPTILDRPNKAGMADYLLGDFRF